MTDNLRDRIAAALAEHREYQGNDCQCGWKDDTGLYKVFSWEDDTGLYKVLTGHEQHQADAVIKELGLREESGLSGYHVTINPGGYHRRGAHVTRYVTEWETDETD